jgi:cobalt-zinc-cadmium efflux system outer membrane protein
LNERRYALGAISEAELSKTEVAALESDQVLDQAAQSLRAAKVGLAFLLGFRQLVPEFSLDAKALDYALPGPVARATREALLHDALERRPDLRATLAQEERAQAALSLARRNRFPDVGLGFSYSANGSGDSTISPPNASISLSFAPPLFYLQAGEIRRAEADLVTQRVLHQKAQALVVSDVETAFAQLQAQRRLVERMQGALLARAQRTRDLVQVQYEKGAASLLELLDAQRTFTAVRGEYLQNLTSYWIAVAALEAAAAMDLSR